MILLVVRTSARFIAHILIVYCIYISKLHVLFKEDTAIEKDLIAYVILLTSISTTKYYVRPIIVMYFGGIRGHFTR